MECSNCRAKNRSQAQFCHNCGERLAVAKNPSEAPEKSQSDNKVFRFAIIGMLSLIMCGVCGLSSWVGWRIYSGRQTPVAESDVIEIFPTYTPVLTLPISTDLPSLTSTPSPVLPDNSNPSSERIVYVHFMDDGFLRYFASISPDGVSSNQLLDLPIDGQEGIPFSLFSFQLLFSQNEQFMLLPKFDRQFEPDGLWLADLAKGEMVLLPESENAYIGSEILGANFSPDSKSLAGCRRSHFVTA